MDRFDPFELGCIFQTILATFAALGFVVTLYLIAAIIGQLIANCG